MGKVFWLTAVIVITLLGATLWTALGARFEFKHHTLQGEPIVIDPQTGAAVAVNRAAPGSHLLGETKPQPRAIAGEVEHNFGVMDPLTMGEHKFVIRNTGEAPLELNIGPTTCKCTVSGLSSNRVEPGEFASVKLEWNSGRKDLEFAQAATVYTNDPRKKSIEFTVTGKVRMLIGADVAQIDLPAQNPDNSAVAEFLVYSQIWDEFEIVGLEAPLPGLTWRAEAVPAESAPNLARGRCSACIWSSPCRSPKASSRTTCASKSSRPAPKQRRRTSTCRSAVPSSAALPCMGRTSARTALLTWAFSIRSNRGAPGC